MFTSDAPSAGAASHRVRVALASVVAVVALTVGTGSAVNALEPAPGGFASWHETSTATSGGRAETLASDLGGFIWYADGTSNQLVRVDPISGSQTPFDLGPSHPGVIDLTMSPAGDMWFGDAANSAIDRLDPRTGTVDSYVLGGPFDSAFSLVVGVDGRIWFGEPSAGGLGAIAPDGTITRIPDPDGGIIINVVSAPDGRLWYTKAGRDSLGTYDPRTGVFDSVPTGLSGVSGLAVAHDGAVWVGGVGALARITPAGVVTSIPVPPAWWGSISPTSLTAGEFAQLYFCDGAGNIGRVDSAGTVSFITPPFAGAMPNRLAVSSIGTLWYTDFARGTLGSV